VAEAPIEKLLDQVDWKGLPQASPSFAGDPDVPYATHEGTLELGELRLRCYQLNDGRRIFDAEDVAALFESGEES
jgi:hypothetical protein